MDMKSNFVRLVVALFVSFALWLYVISTVSPESEETYYDIPVSYQNDVLEERGLMIVSDTPTVTLKLKGNRSDLNELNASNITILVNLAEIQSPGTHMLKYNTSYPANLPNNAFETLSQTPNLLKLKVEEKIKKAVPIQLEYIGSVPEGFVAEKDNPVLDISVVEVSGPKSSVDLIHHASIQVDLTDQTESIMGAFSYMLCDEAGEPVDAQMVVTNVEEVNLSVKVQAIKEIPLVLNLVDGGGATKDSCQVDLSRETIVVSGNEARLRELEYIELGTVNLAELMDETNTMNFEIVLPDGITNSSGVTEVTATITFPDLVRKTFSINKTQFQTIGVPAGANVIWITEVVEVELRGLRETIQKMTEKDITVTFDFTGEELGSISKMPQVSLPAEYSSVGEVSVSSVTATLQMGEPNATTSTSPEQ